MKAFRFHSKFLNDPRIGRLKTEWQLAIVKLMCLEAKGELDPNYIDENEEDLCAAIGLDENDWPNLKKHLFSRGMLENGKRYGYRTNIYGHLTQDYGRLPAKEWAEVRSAVFQRDDYTCQYCGDRAVSLQCDHIIPVSRGGSNNYSNLATACKQCNQSKHNKTPEEWRDSR